MRLVDNVKLVGRIEWDRIDAFAYRTYLVDPAIGGRVYLVQILGGYAELVRENARDRRFPCSSTSCEKIRMRHFFILDGLFECLGHVRLPMHFGKCAWSVLPIERRMTSLLFHADTIAP